MYSKELIEFCNKVKPIKLSVTKNKEEIEYKNLLYQETLFLDIINASISTRYYCVINNIIEIPKCKCCNNYCVANKKDYKLGFSEYCSLECSRKSKTVSKEILEKLNDRDWLYTQRVILKKSKETIARELGCSTAPINKKLLEFNIEVKKKVKNVKEEIPSKNTLETLYFQENLTLLDISKKYTVSNTTVRKWFKEYNIQINTHSKTIKYKVIPKIIETNLEKYGIEYYSQKHYSKELISKLNNREWLYKEHIINERSLTDISRELNISDLTLKKYFDLYNVETKLFQKSDGEKELYKFISQYFVCVSSDREIIKPKELDVYIPEKNFAIEYCGIYYHSSIYKSNSYHKNKYEQCKSKGIKLITLYEDEWLNNKDLVKNKLLHLLGINNIKKIYARKCKIQIVNKNEKNEFYNSYHIQGDGNSSINIGLFYNEELVACLGFKKLKFDCYELDRYSTKYNVVGGFSKLLNYFKFNYSWNTIITFSDLRWHDGNLYKQTGFIFDKIIRHDYQYVYKRKRIHKFNFRKKLIQKKFPEIYDENLSEKELMDILGIPRIYDCGKIRWKLVNKKG